MDSTKICSKGFITPLVGKLGADKQYRAFEIGTFLGTYGTYKGAFYEYIYLVRIDGFDAFEYHFVLGRVTK